MYEVSVGGKVIGTYNSKAEAKQVLAGIKAAQAEAQKQQAAQQSNLYASLNGHPDLALSSGGVDFSLAAMYIHFQFGGGNPMTINASSIDFSGTNQRQLGLDKIGIGKTLDPVNLFNAGINSNSLAFGRLSMTRVSETQFSIAPNKFDFDYQPDASWQRNAGTMLGGAVNYNLWLSPGSALVPLIFGGSYWVNFNGTATIPK
ncbi:MAG: hypothetical protein HY840_02375 [Bacteroidetes bacterium]|nr:hypothetical protein [Bacteroidota bacterium]